MTDQATVGVPKNYVKGYRPVLIREELKSQLSQFRRDNGLTESSHERCLVTSAVALVLANEDLRNRWMNEFGLAVRREAAEFLPSTQFASCSKDAPNSGSTAHGAIKR